MEISEGTAIPENIVNRGSNLSPREEKDREIERLGGRDVGTYSSGRIALFLPYYHCNTLH